MTNLHLPYPLPFSARVYLTSFLHPDIPEEYFTAGTIRLSSPSSPVRNLEMAFQSAVRPPSGPDIIADLP